MAGNEPYRCLADERNAKIKFLVSDRRIEVSSLYATCAIACNQTQMQQDFSCLAVNLVDRCFYAKPMMPFRVPHAYPKTSYLYGLALMFVVVERRPYPLASTAHKENSLWKSKRTFR